MPINCRLAKMMGFANGSTHAPRCRPDKLTKCATMEWSVDFARRAKRPGVSPGGVAQASGRPTATLHGVVFDISVGSQPRAVVGRFRGANHIDACAVAFPPRQGSR